MSDSREKQQYFLEIAGEYCASAYALYNASGSNRPIIFMVWQSAEESLKSLLNNEALADREMHTHDLGRIMNRLRQDQVLTNNDLNQLSSSGAAITGSRDYNDSRYPDNDPSYWKSQSRDSIKAAVEGAKYFLDFAIAKGNLRYQSRLPESS